MYYIITVFNILLYCKYFILKEKFLMLSVVKFLNNLTVFQKLTLSVLEFIFLNNKHSVTVLQRTQIEIYF